MADKPGFTAVTGFQGGVSVGITADTFAEFVAYCEQVWPGEGSTVARGLYQILKGNAVVVAPTEGQAVQMLQQQMGAVPVQQATQVQQAYGQQYAQQPPPYQQQFNSNGPPPGQTCDPNDPTKTKWVPPGVSSKTGKAYKGFWAKP